MAEANISISTSILVSDSTGAAATWLRVVPCPSYWGDESVDIPPERADGKAGLTGVAVDVDVAKTGASKGLDTSASKEEFLGSLG